jgi:TrpR family trp operon transcriptional repressor
MARVKHQVDMQAFEAVASVLSAIESPQEMRLFLKELLTPAEVRDITLRWRLLELLAEGVSQRKIAEELKISLCKITRGSRILKQKGAVTSRVLKAQHPKRDAE